LNGGGNSGSRLRLGSWILYDLANTVYAAVLTFLFTDFIKAEDGGVTAYSVVNFASMAVAAVLVPKLGALADHTARARRYLTVTTLACIASMACWGFDLSAGTLLALFFVANLSFNLSLLSYNALLASVATTDRAGRASAIGVGVGYGGTILVLAVLLPLDIPVKDKFPLAAAMFLVFALPCLILVRDHRKPRTGNSGEAIRGAFASLRSTIRQLPRHRPLMWFLLANFCFVDVLNTAVLFFSELTRSSFADAAAAGPIRLLWLEFDGAGALTQLVMVLGLALNGLALVFGLSIGRWADRAPLRLMACSGIALLGALIGGAVFAGNSALGYLLTLVTLGAFGLTGIWTTGRKIIVVLAPPDQVGEYFGLYGITTKLSVFGAVIYGLVRDAYDAQTALLSQGPQLCLGLLFLAMVRLPQRPAECDTA